ncbi:ATP-binding cassette domain-containing protein [bacterium]|nr:MAG: ATP-binding cassette domain-containing protein [bacterium]
MSREGPSGVGPLPILTVERLVKRFGGFRALDGVGFTLHAGEILGLVGPNGSGKTTCINVISGIYRPDGGRVLLDGRPAGGLPSHRLVHLGVNRTFQVPKPFLAFTVRENVELAVAYGRDPDADPHEFISFVGLEDLVERQAATLNSAQQKMLDLARALATRPRLLLVDELAAGLNPSELEAVAEKLLSLARLGTALVVVEHLLGFIDRVAHRVVVMNAGRDIFHGGLGEASQDPQVIEVFLGG